MLHWYYKVTIILRKKYQRDNNCETERVLFKDITGFLCDFFLTAQPCIGFGKLMLTHFIGMRNTCKLLKCLLDS